MWLQLLYDLEKFIKGNMRKFTVSFGHAHGVGVQSRYKICNAKKHVGV